MRVRVASTRRRSAVPLIAVALLVSCGGDGSIARAGPEAKGATLAGSSWVSTDVEGHDLLPGTAISLEFSDSQLSVWAGCNTLTGQYRLEGDRLEVPDGLESTTVGCDPPERHDQDDWLADLLVAGSGVEVGDRSLVLTGGEVRVRLVDESVVDPDRSLTGVTWTVETLIDGEAASNVPAELDPPTFQVAEDGTAELFTACNDASGTVRAQDDVLELALIVSDAVCPGAAGEVEDHVLEVLGGAAASFEIAGSTLVVSAGDMSLAMKAQ